jgi:predicted glycosyltransferase
MKIVVDINHPAHIHFFKNMINQLSVKGHEILLTASDKDISIRLLERFGFPFIKLGSYGTSLFSKAINLALLDWRMYQAVKGFDPDIFLGAGSIRAAHISKLLKKPCIIFEDTEHSREQYLLYAPFVDYIFTPSSFKRRLGRKQFFYNGFHELAYLHPNSFTPNPEVLIEIGISEQDIFSVVRFISWSASHDIGQHGIRDKIKLVKTLERYGRVFVVAEGKEDPAWENYNIRVAPEKLHHLLYYASLYLGEGGTIAAEAAVLGTYAIHVSTTAKHCGIFTELQKYGLLDFFDAEVEALPKALELLKRPNIKIECRQNRNRLLKDKLEMTMFLVWLIESFPESIKIISVQPEFLDIFKGGGR